MEVSITQFRRNLFSLVDQALAGDEVCFTHKGHRLRITTEAKPTSRLSRLTPMQITQPGSCDLDEPAFKAQQMAELEAEWEKDWSLL